MVKHIVYWVMKPQAEGCTAAENIEKVKQMGTALMGKVPGLTHIEVSSKFHSATCPVDLILYSEHESSDAYDVYAKHPEHLPVIDFMGKVAEGRWAINYIV